MLLAFFLGAAQAATPPAQGGSIDVTDSIVAYTNWRLCLDARLGEPPRPNAPTRQALEEAFAACCSHEESLRTATAAALGPEQGAEMFANMVREARAEVSAPFPPKR